MTISLTAAPATRPDGDVAPAPIDLVHLARQCLGDRALETELLGLFERQAHAIIDSLSQTPARIDLKARADLAHTLKGSALAVGARRVADAAQAYENAAARNTDAQIAALQIAVDEARRAVESLLAA